MHCGPSFPHARHFPSLHFHSTLSSLEQLPHLLKVLHKCHFCWDASQAVPPPAGHSVLSTDSQGPMSTVVLCGHVASLLLIQCGHCSTCKGAGTGHHLLGHQVLEDRPVWSHLPLSPECLAGRIIVYYVCFHRPSPNIECEADIPQIS